MWFYLPSMCYPSAQEQVALNSDCASPSETPCELSVTLSGKSTQRPISWRGWKTRPWIQRLFGTTLRPLTASRGAGLWIASLRATRANPTQLPASVAAMQMSATFGPQWRESLMSRGLPLCSWRTCQQSLIPGTESEIAYGEWVTKLRRDCSLRRKLGRATGDCDSSDWPTPAAQEDNKSPEAHMAMKARMKGGPRKTITSLQVASKLWQTPSNADTLGGHLSRGGDRSDELLLRGQVKQWPTPKATEAGSLNRSPQGGPPQDLAISAKQWATPRANEAQQQNSQDAHVALSRQAPRSLIGGRKSSENTRRLNPLFVEWLMGWPTGMTDCDCAETGLSPWLQRMRSALYSLVLGMVIADD